jgi:MFS family permease
MLPETNKFKHTDFIKPKILKINLKKLFVEPTFIISMLLLALGYAMFTAWLTAGPIVLQQVVLITPIEFGWCAAAVSLSYFVSVLINSKLVNKFDLLTMQRFGAKCVLAAGGIMLIPIIFFHHISTAAIVLPVMLTLFGMGMIAPNAFTTGLTPFAKIAGIATAILASVQMLGGFIGSTIISLAPERNQLPIGLVIFTCGIIAIILVSFLKRANK